MYYFIVNEAGGRGRAREKWLEIRRALLNKGIPHKAWMTHAAGEATALAREVSAQNDGDKRLVVLGGDGTINEVINGITRFDEVSLGVVPIGSGNDFARGLGLSKNLDEALRAIFASKANKRIDVGRVRVDGHAPRHFSISAGVGMDAMVCQMVDKSTSKSWLNHFNLGHLSYGLLTLRAVTNLISAGGEVRFDTPSGPIIRTFDKMLFLAAMNFSCEGGGVPMAPEATADDGLLSACMANNFTTPRAYSVLPLLATGHHARVNGVSVTDARRIEVWLDEALPVHADGEIVGVGRHLVFEALPKKMRVLI